jgi:hypothetical protein
VTTRNRTKEGDMSDQPWGAGDNSPMGEGTENSAVGPGSVGEQRAGEDETAQGRRENDGSGKQPWGRDEDNYGGAAEQGGQPNLSPDPPVAGRPSRQPPGTTKEDTAALGDRAWPGAADG